MCVCVSVRERETEREAEGRLLDVRANGKVQSDPPGTLSLPIKSARLLQQNTGDSERNTCYHLESSKGEKVIQKVGDLDFPGGAVVKNPPANAGDMGLSPGPGRSHMTWSN